MTPDPRPQSIAAPATEALLAAVAGNPVAMVNCARTLLLASGQTDRARDICREALALDPGNAEALALARPILSDGIGSWYFTMVLDHRRHALYARALAKLLSNGGVVLDIGAGTGVFAMLAVRAGASHVIACERDPHVARAASEAIARNGFADRITVLPVDSRELQVGRDLAEPADVLLWDNLANNFLGAGCAATLADAAARLVKPGAAVLPGRAELLAAAVTDLEADEHRMGLVDGLDMEAFNLLRGSDFTIARDKFELRSAPAVLFDFDVSGGAPIRPARAQEALTLTAGRVDGIAQWLRFHLGDGLVYDTLDEDVRAFGAQFHVTETFEAAPGTAVRLHGAHDTLDTWFWLER
ncbi:50S ribosomal protein L11 methyltransferase [Novosphingobium resinovorum]|uniref:50S ribosomal protein L11 methyltransferase n=1 Tax=Novosphingobium resinovorum TaxID=158500 RepID=UPI002ED38184|nr:50S ribosomal protein L11 methyltransferase [Novosphingobium resinovorum]